MDFREAHRALVARILEGAGEAPTAQRRAAFDNAGLPDALRTLIQKVALRARDVTDEDIAAARAAGFSEDQLFELMICAAVGQATRQAESAFAALDAALGRA